MACSRADTTGRSTSNSKRSSAAGRSPGAPSGICPGSTQDACQSSVQSRPVSNQAGSRRRALAQVGLDRDPPLDPLGRRQRRPGVGHEQALVAVDPAGVPAVVGGDPVGVLLAGAVRQPPRQPRRGRPDAERRRRGARPAGSAGPAVTARPWSRRRGRRRCVPTDSVTSPGSTAQPRPVSQCRRARACTSTGTSTVSPGSAVTTAKPASQRAGRSTAESGPRGVDLHDLLAAPVAGVAHPDRRRQPVAGRRRVDRLVLPASCSRGRGRTSRPARCRPPGRRGARCRGPRRTRAARRWASPRAPARRPVAVGPGRGQPAAGLDVRPAGRRPARCRTPCPGTRTPGRRTPRRATAAPRASRR